MILFLEPIFLEVVRDFLIERLDLNQDQINVEIDDNDIPPTVGDTYLSISPYGIKPGKHNFQADQIFHYEIGLRVVATKRCADVAKDRRRNVFLDQLCGINAELAEVMRHLRFCHELTCLATKQFMAAAPKGVEGKFTRPLIPVGIDQRPKMVTGEVFGARKTNSGGEMAVAMQRGVNFGRAEFIGDEK